MPQLQSKQTKHLPDFTVKALYSKKDNTHGSTEIGACWFYQSKDNTTQGLSVSLKSLPLSDRIVLWQNDASDYRAFQTGDKAPDYRVMGVYERNDGKTGYIEIGAGWTNVSEKAESVAINCTLNALPLTDSIVLWENTDDT